jgi:Bacterial Ig-like domain (group 2)/Abnormal spindle-like microcephaly-assoc'd, ASPM-SPD-2-Hydin/Galactose oxidase, central domain/Protein of unknown function (DUF1573)
MKSLKRRLTWSISCWLFLWLVSQLNAQVASLSTTSVNFGGQAVGTTSSTRTVRLTNTGTASLVISSITPPSAPFVESNDCPSSLAQNTSCRISVTFSPSTIGAFSGSISISDNASGSPQTINLSGTGVQPVTLSPSNMSFGKITLGSSSAARTVTLRNVQNVPLTITSISTSANFSQTNACPTSPSTLAAGATCAINIVFTPSSLGAVSGTLTVVHNAFGSPATATLSGTGTNPLTLAPSSLTFAAQNIGTTSGSKTIQVTNAQPTALSISSIQTTGDFSESSSCPIAPQTLAAGGSCNIAVKFSPSAAGTRTGQLLINDSAVISPQTAALTGTGVAVLQSISVSPATATIAVGQTQQFVATGSYNDGSQKNISSSARWTSSRSSVATVNASGVATGVSNGTVTISATMSGITGTASLTVGGVAPPVISSFNAGASTITAGNSTTLTAVFSGGTGTINNGVGAVASSTPVTVTPATTTTYTLTVTNSAGSVSATATVTVVPAPAISSFTAAASTITAGNSTTLTAVFSGGTGSVNNGVGAVVSGTPVTVTPAATATYTLTVTNSAGTSVSASVTVTVVPAPTITSFTAGATNITPGNSSSLTAVFSGGNGSVNNGVGAVTSGTPVTVTPAATTTYTLTVTNAAGTSVTSTVTVNVVGGLFSNGSSLDVVAHSATLLNNGSVLIAGGVTSGDGANPNGYVVNPQLYDPAAGTFTNTGSMVTARSSHSATLLNSGVVLIAGGSDTSANLIAGGELYDPVAGIFSPTTGNLNVPRINHTATVLRDGTVLIAGGTPGSFGSATDSAEIYDPVAGTFTPTASTMTTARWSHTATLLSNGTVLIAGGVDGHFNTLSSAEIYDPVAQTFTAITTPMNAARSSYTATLLNDGTVLMAGCDNSASASAELYTSTGRTTGTFTSTGSMSTGRCFANATLLNNGTVLIAGGYSASSAFLTSAEVYDPNSGAFIPTGSLNTARYQSTSTRLNNGNVLVVGGWTNNQPPSNPTISELYQPVAQTPLNLASIAVTPSYQVITLGSTQRFIAMGTFNTNNVTSVQQLSSVTWSSTDVSGSNVAQISNDATNPGVALALSQGTATITACAGAICGSATLAVGTLNYYQVSSSSSPNPRCCVGMAFDPATNSTVMFGGVEGYYSALGDTWTLDVAGGGGWSQLSPANSPTAREGPAMAYDAATGTVVLFGGTTGLFGTGGVDLNDTWIWDGTAWTQVFPPISPPGRRFDGQGMAYDAISGNVILFGGAVQGNTVLGDTWAWNGTAQTWTQLSPATSPSPRAFAGMSSGGATGGIVLFGGGDYTQNLGDTWVWNGSNWQQRSPSTSPPARSGLSMVFDDSISKVVLFGGYQLDDTWTWDGNNWTQLVPASTPPDRYSYGMDYDGAAHAVVLFGGFSSAPIRGDTWKLSVAP